MSVKMYNLGVQLSKHFNSSEFKCPHCGKIKLSSKLIDKLEVLFDRVHASKCIISSGYRCKDYDIRENGFTGGHSEGLFMIKMVGLYLVKLFVVLLMIWDLVELHILIKIIHI